MEVTVVFDHGLADRKGLPLPTLQTKEKTSELVYSRYQAKEENKEGRLLLFHLQQNLWSSLPESTPPGPDGRRRIAESKRGGAAMSWSRWLMC